ncbi:hypothetical protein [Pandoraea capi]|nr:hypothetical protein [Pandoraea capi]
MPGMILMFRGDATDHANDKKTATLYLAGHQQPLWTRTLGVMKAGLDRFGLNPPSEPRRYTAPFLSLKEALAPYFQEMFPEFDASTDRISSIQLDRCDGDIFEKMVANGAMVVRNRASGSMCSDFDSEKERRAMWFAWIFGRAAGIPAEVAAPPETSDLDAVSDIAGPHWLSGLTLREPFDYNDERLDQHIADVTVAVQESTQRQHRQLDEMIRNRFNTHTS